MSASSYEREPMRGALKESEIDEPPAVKGEERAGFMRKDAPGGARTVGYVPWPVGSMLSIQRQKYLLYRQTRSVKRAKSTCAVRVDSRQATFIVHVRQQLAYAALQLVRWGG